MKIVLLAVSVVFLGLTTAGYLYVRDCGCDESATPAAGTSPAAALAPHEPVHVMFTGCSSACGSKSEGDRAQAKLQPDAKHGDLTFCPVSGAVFRIGDQSTVRQVSGKPLYFCCDMCAGYFDKNPAEVLAKRGLQPLS